MSRRLEAVEGTKDPLVASLRALVRSERWTQEEVAAKLSVTQGYVSRLLRLDHRPRAELAAAITTLLEEHRRAAPVPPTLADRVMDQARRSPEFRRLVENALGIMESRDRQSRK